MQLDKIRLDSTLLDELIYLNRKRRSSFSYLLNLRLLKYAYEKFLNFLPSPTISNVNRQRRKSSASLKSFFSLNKKKMASITAERRRSVFYIDEFEGFAELRVHSYPKKEFLASFNGVISNDKLS